MGSRPPLKIQAASAPPSKTTFGENSTKSQWKNSGASWKCLNNDAAFFGAVGLGSGPHFSDPSGWAGRRRSYMGGSPLPATLCRSPSSLGQALLVSMLLGGWPGCK